MYDWSMVLAPDSALKRAVDCVICSICYVHPEFFALLLEWMGIMVRADISRTELYTDDHKDSQQNQPLTDDVKEARGGTNIAIDGLETTSSTNASASNGETDYQPFVLQELRRICLRESYLSTLAVACQSPLALQQLLESGFIAMLCQGLYEVGSRELRSQRDDPMVFAAGSSAGATVPPEPYTDASKRWDANSGASSSALGPSVNRQSDARLMAESSHQAGLC